MTTFESKAVIDKPVEEVYAFLADLNNHQQLMPENIYNWSSTTDEAGFTIQNMAKLSLKVDKRTHNERIEIVPSGDSPIDVRLIWAVQDNQAGGCIAKFTILADLNMMMKLVASGPLQKLVNHQTQKLSSV